MRLVFLGSPPFATPVLARVLESGHEVAALVARPDRPSGRGLRVEPSALVALARERGLPVLQPRTTRDPAVADEIRGFSPEVLLVASWGEILGREILELAPRGALNVHASLLPRHRGASPVQAAILAGDPETGVSVQRMVRRLDEGDVLLALPAPIGARETAGELSRRLAGMGGEAAVGALDLLESGEARFLPQDPSRATYAPKIDKAAGWIDWSKSALDLERHVRAMAPWPGARTRTSAGREVTILDARAPSAAEASSEAPRGPEFDRAPGTILAAGGSPLVVTGNGVLELLSLRPAGKAVLDGAAWVRGARLAPGAHFTSGAS